MMNTSTTTTTAAAAAKAGAAAGALAGVAPLHIKARLGRDVRRFEITNGVRGVNQLESRLRKAYAIDAGVRLTIRYKDDEGDLCTVTANPELHEALRLSCVGLAPGAPLRLELCAGDAPSDSDRAAWRAAKAEWNKTKDELRSACGDKAAWAAAKAQWMRTKGEWLVAQGGPRAAKGEWLKQQAETLEKSGGAAGWKQHCGGHGRGRHGGGGGGWRGVWKARFIADVGLQDGERVSPGAALTKTWRVANPGRSAWPTGTSLLRVGGDDVPTTNGASQVGVPIAGAQQTVDISVDFVAPEEPGRYMTYWRLQDAQGDRFGQRFWCMFHVEAAAAAPTEGEEDDALSTEEEIAAAHACIAAGLSKAQSEHVFAALRGREHLGIVCDVTGASPIVGVRYTRHMGDDTYDVCANAYATLDEAERATLREVDRPELALLVRLVKAYGVCEPAAAAAPVVDAIAADDEDEDEDGEAWERVDARAEPEAEQPPQDEAGDAGEVVARVAETFEFLSPDEAAGFVAQSGMETELISALLEGSLVHELEPSARAYRTQLDAAAATAEQARREAALRAAEAEAEAQRQADDAAALAAEADAARQLAEAEATRAAEAARIAAEEQAAAEAAEAARIAAEEQAAAEAAEAARIAAEEQAAAEVAARAQKERDAEAAAEAAAETERMRRASEVDAAKHQMAEMGFSDEAAVERALSENGYDIARTVAYLLRQ